MIFCAFRYVSGVTIAHAYDVRMVRAGRSHKTVFGIITDIVAEDVDEARAEANRRFDAGDFNLTHRGQEICQQLLEKARGGK